MVELKSLVREKECFLFLFFFLFFLKEKPASNRFSLDLHFKYWKYDAASVIFSLVLGEVRALQNAISFCEKSV